MIKPLKNRTWFPVARRPRRRGAKSGGSLTLSRRIRPSLDVLEDRTTPSTFLVTNAVDPTGRLVPGSLRWAITSANRSPSRNPLVEITSSVGSSITLRSGELRISNSLTIENAAGAPVTIQQSTPNSRVLDVLADPRTKAVTVTGLGAGSSLTLTGGRVRNGNGGGILVDNPQNILTLQYVNVVGNFAAQVRNPLLGARGNGGGVYSRGTLTLDHATVMGNIALGINNASGHGGGVYTDRGVTLSESHVDGNKARNSSGIFNVFGSVEVVNGSTVNNNAPTGNGLLFGDLGGGGIGQTDGNVVIADSQVDNNRSNGMYSGGIGILLGGITVTDGSQIDGDSNNGPGGGIAANFGGAVVITGGSQVDGNTAAGIGGGIVNFSENFGIDVDDSEVANNAVTNTQDTSAAAGLARLGENPLIAKLFVGIGRGDPSLKDALQLFVNACAQRVDLINAAVDAFPSGGQIQIGAGIASPLNGSIVIADGSTISGNEFTAVRSSTIPAAGYGGGIFANLGSITIDGSTISGNVASVDAGGVWNGFSLVLRNSTVTGNRAAQLGGGIYNQGSFVSVNNNISGNLPDNVYPQP
jgi:fibronectin-binding autotransporter adhesin